MKKNLFIYLPAIAVVLAVKVYYRTADSDMLLWILTPTTWWVRVLSGISFENISHVGYVSHEYRFIIAASCSGVRFMLLTFTMMIFSFTRLMDSARKKVCWAGFSAVFSYISTIFVNGIRITVSIYLPLVLMDKKLMSGWLTAEKLHTIIGTSVYFSMLFAIYYLAGKFFSRFFGLTGYTKSQGQTVYFIVPVFWYFVMVLGIPFAGRLYRNDWTGFWQYTVLVISICSCVMLLLLMHTGIHKKYVSKMTDARRTSSGEGHSTTRLWGNLWRLKR